MINPFKTKKEYRKNCFEFNLPENPERVFSKSKFNWIDYLNINRNQYYNKDNCIKTVKKLSLGYNIDLVKHCYDHCQIDTKFPPYDLWCELYEVDLEYFFENDEIKQYRLSKYYLIFKL